MTDQALGRYQDLCIDADDPRALGEFWAGVLGLRLEALDDGDVRLVGPTPRHTVWINRVPEPRTVKHRWHIDVHARGVEEVLARGAVPVDLDTHAWAIVADPEGGELCVFTREEPPAYRLYEVVVACGDAVAQACWWARVLGGTVHLEDDDGEWGWVDGIDGLPFDCLTFVPVPEPKTVKNRVHIDITTPSVAALVDAGARVIGQGPRWQVLADPEGNEFCAFEQG